MSEGHSSNVDAGYGQIQFWRNGTLTWNFHTLSPGESASASWIGKPNAGCGTLPVTISNTAKVSSAEYNWRWVESTVTLTVVP